VSRVRIGYNLRARTRFECVPRAVLSQLAHEAPDDMFIGAAEPWQNGSSEYHNGKWCDERLAM